MGSLRLYPSLTTFGQASEHDLVRNSAFCRTLSPEALGQLQRAGLLQHYRKGETVFRQREEATHFYLLLKGKVSITAARESGEDTIVDILPEGNLFLMNSALLELPYMVTAEAVTDIRVLAVPVAEFKEMLAKHPSLALITLNQLAAQTRMLVDQVRQLKLQSANERLAHYILSLVDITEGSAITELEEERRVIAQRLGMTPESLSRSIAALKNVGVIFEQRTVRVADAAALRNYCGLEAMV